jgi:hypothetical protein
MTASIFFTHASGTGRLILSSHYFCTERAAAATWADDAWAASAYAHRLGIALPYAQAASIIGR